MNSYNDNLHSVVVNSLLDQELNLKTVKSEAIASMFTLYHAQDATITAQENLNDAQTDLDARVEVNNQAVAGTNISNNLLSAATQCNTYLKQSVTNTSVCASNVQIAANAIVKLASDMGSVYSIVHAADYKSDIYETTEEARALINETAYLAEVASDMAMEASILTSEVASTAVLNKAKNSNTTLGNLYSITTADFNTASQTVATDTANVASASVTEQAAEGDFEDISTDSKAAIGAYHLMNAELNMNLRVSPIVTLKPNAAKTKTDTSSTRNIRFNFIRSPFGWDIASGSTVNPISYPVQDYYLIAVKEKSKTTFSIANAENIVTNGTGDANPRFIRMPEECYLAKEVIAMHQDLKPVSNKLQEQLTVPREKDGITIHLRVDGASLDVDFFNIDGKTLYDADGQAMVQGTSYVIFVYARYQEAYKKKINSFDDFLSAASLPFTLTTKVVAPEGTSIVMDAKANAPANSFSFTIDTLPDYAVEYRCMLLPYGEGVPAGLLNKLSLEQLELQLVQIQTVADAYDPRIAVLQAQLLRTDLKPEEKNKLTAGIRDLEQARNADMESLQILNAATVRMKANGKGSTAVPVKTEIGFLFNRTLAEEVTADNYLSKKFNPAEDKAPRREQEMYHFTVPFTAATTDIFGRLLSNGSKYVPVVLAVFDGEAEDEAMFTNAWSGYENSPVYAYQPSPIKTEAGNKGK
jgi:hypothetical protein